MHILITNLHEHRAAFRQQFPRHGEPVPEIAEIRVNPVAPGVAESLDLLGLPGDVFGPAVLDVAAGGGPLEIRVEPDAIRRVDIDALDLAAQSFALGEGGHDPEAVAENHAVRPVGVVAVELGPGVFVRQAVEIGKQVDLGFGGLPVRLGAAREIVHERLGMDFLLDVQRRRIHHQIRLVLRVLAAPDELGVKIAVAALVGNPQRRLLFRLDQGLGFRRGNIPAGGVPMPERLHRLVLRLLALRHCCSPLLWRFYQSAFFLS